MNKHIPDIYNLIQELSWHFGNHGFNGECCGDLSLVEFMALKKVHGNNEFTVQEVGNVINFTKSGATRIIDRLEDKGYVKRERSPVDGRVCCVAITNRGKDTVSTIIERRTAYVEEMLKEYEPGIVENIKAVLEILVHSAKEQEQI